MIGVPQYGLFILNVTARSGAKHYGFLPRSFVKRCVAATMTPNKRLPADNAHRGVLNAGCKAGKVVL